MTSVLQTVIGFHWTTRELTPQLTHIFTPSFQALYACGTLFLLKSNPAPQWLVSRDPWIPLPLGHLTKIKYNDFTFYTILLFTKWFPHSPFGIYSKFCTPINHKTPKPLADISDAQHIVSRSWSNHQVWCFQLNAKKKKKKKIFWRFSFFLRFSIKLWENIQLLIQRCI